MLDPETGDFWQYSQDQAVHIPLLELAGKHARHINRITCVYNLRDDSVEKTNPSLRKAASARIRAMPKYRPLPSLSGSPEKE